MKRYINRGILAISLCLSLQIGAAAGGPRTFYISADDWARPRSGQGLIEYASLRDLATVWSTLPAGSVIEIRYPGGDEGGLWAAELSDWLVSLGFASESIRLTPGSPRVDRIELVIVEPQH